MRLLIVSHTTHYHSGEAYAGWGPTVRELDALAEMFDEIVHVATIYPGPAPTSAMPYSAPNIRLRLVTPAGGDSPADKLRILTAYPDYAQVIREEMNRADAVQVRCPANISLLALLLMRRMKHPPYRWVKYAGNWRPDGDEPWSYGLQRRWLAENRHRGVVTVNGRWPDQQPHIHSFDNPCLTEEETTRGSDAAAAKHLSLPVELLFVGALNEGKGVGRVLRVARALQVQGIPFRLRLLGDGPDRPHYEAWARRQDIRDVSFLGWVPRSDIAEYYASSHFILLPSQSEGWPKVLSEAMAFGTVPVAAAVSSIPQILAETRAGSAFPPDDIDGMAGAIARFVNDPAAWSAASTAGVSAARRFTYQAYRQAVAALFDRAWGVRLPLPPASLVPQPERPGIILLDRSNGLYSRNGYDHH